MASRQIWPSARRRSRFDPLSLAPALWLKADDIVQADGSAVAAWPDASGHARDAAQATAGSRPIIKNDLVNGHNAVRFDGVNDHLYTPSFTLAAGPRLIMVIASRNWATVTGAYHGMYGQGVTGASGLLLEVAGGTAIDWGANDVMFTVAGTNGGQNPRAMVPHGLADSSHHIFLARALGNSVIEMFVDGVWKNPRTVYTNSGGSGVINVPATTAQAVIGAANGSPADLWDGDIFEVFVCDTQGHIDDIGNLVEYAKTKYAIT